MSKAKIVFYSLLVLLFVFICYHFLLQIFIEKSEDRGLFGDSFGGLNALISGLAFAGIIYTILLQQSQLKIQREELILQRKELELTRKELKRSAEAQEKSEIALSKQAQNLELSSQISMITALFRSYHDILKTDSNLHWETKQEMRDKMSALSIKLEKLSNRIQE